MSQGLSSIPEGKQLTSFPALPPGRIASWLLSPAKAVPECPGMRWDGVARECVNQDGGGTLIMFEFMPWPVYRCSHLPVFSSRETSEGVLHLLNLPEMGWHDI